MEEEGVDKEEGAVGTALAGCEVPQSSACVVICSVNVLATSSSASSSLFTASEANHSSGLRSNSSCSSLICGGSGSSLTRLEFPTCSGGASSLHKGRVSRRKQEIKPCYA